MERLVRLISPRSWLDYGIKLIAFNLAIFAVYMPQEYLIDGWPPDGWGSHVRSLVIIATPCIMLTLSLVGHLDRMQQRLYDLANRDLLTGLWNRRGLLERLANEEGRMTLSGVAILADVDHFKRINDSYGHSFGDDCLVAVARYLEDHLRSSDLVARFGGEEFLLVLVDGDVDVVPDMDLYLRQGVDITPEGGGTVRVTLSGGAYPFAAGETLDDVLQRADAALYLAKSQGRARVVLSSAAA